MSNKKILLISLLATFLISLIPIQRYDAAGLECPENPKGICWQKLPSHGFPFVIADTTPFESPVGYIDWSAETIVFAIPPFIVNWLILFLLIILIKKGYKKIKSPN